MAEATIDDVDKLLLANQVNFCRYSDDYRLFCKSKTDAYGRLAQLAEALYRNHGLTLQPSKTRIIDASQFIDDASQSPESKEVNNLEEQFERIIEVLELESRYAPIDYNDLEPEQQALVDELNLEDLLAAELAKDDLDIDIALMKFLLRRFAQLNDSDVALKVIRHAEKCYPVLASIMGYIGALTDMTPTRRGEIGEQVMKLLHSSTVGHLPYHRCWLLTPFAKRNGWGQGNELVSIYESSNDPFTRREAVLAMGRAKLAYWFRTRLDGAAMNLEPWQRRAFLAAASCLPKAERRHWYQSQQARFDELERAVVDWATANPF